MRHVALVLVMLSLAACSPLDLLNLVAPRTGYQLTRDISYGELARQHLDVYTPVGGQAPAPVVLFLHGGRWSDGSKAQYRFVGQALASRGLVAVIPDYRRYPEVRFPAFIEDGAKAAGWTRQHIGAYGGDRDCLYLMGHSSGAHIAAMLALDERYLLAQAMARDDVCGLIGLAGPYDFLPLTAPDLKDIFAPADDLEQTQPIHFVDGNEPPLLLITGADDETVRPTNAINLAQRVRAAGGEARLIQYPGCGHVGILLALAAPLRRLAPVLRDVTEFIGASSKVARRARADEAEHPRAPDLTRTP